MLQAYIDDSISDQPPIFVQAGYIAPAEKWAAFSNKWQAVLDIEPRLEYFKMKEAWALRGQFDGWSEERRNERLEMLYRVIEEFVTGSFYIGFRPDALKRAFAMFPKKFGHPYYFSVPRLMADVGRNLESFGLPIGPVDFVFDTQLHEKRHLIASWEWGTPRAKPNPPELGVILSNAPSFQDDKKVLPLQAADFLAWWLRRNFAAQATNKEVLKPPFDLRRSIPISETQYNEEQLKQAAQAMSKISGKITATFG